MTKIYFIINQLFLKENMLYKKELSEEEKKEKTLLSRKGEQMASKLAKAEKLNEVSAIYSSNYLSAMESARFLSEEKHLGICVDERLKERKVGILGNNNERFLKETQEHDFDYKLHNGESLNMVQTRMKECLKEILRKHENETIAIFTHDFAVKSLLCLWCDIGYNLENQLILTRQEEVMMDGGYHPFRMFCLEFEQGKIKKISWEEIDE